LNHTDKRSAAWRRFLPGILIAVALGAVLVAGISQAGDEGGSSATDSEPAAPDYDRMLAAAPPELKRLYENEPLVEGGPAELERRIAELRGFPVVVNVWASWCGPCREEFPYFQALAAERGDRVAFLGVNSEDSEDAALTFLEDYPLPYPSVVDGEGEVRDELLSPGLPATAFYDERGELVHTQPGPYRSRDELAADVERYAG
jgi:thiol-disulfide isomerase/thioredoxin